MLNRKIASVFMFSTFATSSALALCRLPADPGLVCGLGRTAIRGTVQATDGDLLTVSIDEVAGQPIDGIEVGVDAVISPDTSESPDAVLPPKSGQAFFVLSDSSTFVLGVRIDDDNRVPIGGDGSEAVPAAYFLTMATDEDAERCRNVAFQVVDPPVASYGGCDDEVGCSGVSIRGVMPIGLLFLALRRRARTKLA